MIYGFNIQIQFLIVGLYIEYDFSAGTRRFPFSKKKKKSNNSLLESRKLKIVSILEKKKSCYSVYNWMQSFISDGSLSRVESQTFKDRLNYYKMRLWGVKNESETVAHPTERLNMVAQLSLIDYIRGFIPGTNALRLLLSIWLWL